MTTNVYRFHFDTKVPLEEVEASLLLSIFAVESLHGEAQTRLDAAHHLDEGRRVCVIDSRTDVGRDFARIFTGFLRREFGSGSFTVERVEATSPPGLEAEPAVV